MSHVLVVSPHPDDESIGCGGTLLKHLAQGDAVQVVFLTSGEAGGHGNSPGETARIREQEAKVAADILGIAQIEFWRQPDGAFHVTRAVVDRLRRKLQEWKPEVLYVTHDREMHRDHRAAARIVRQALSDIASPARPAALMFEVWTPIQRIDQVVDISRYMDSKIAAIRAYKSQCHVMRFDDAFLALGRYRGEMHSGWPAANYAEIFTELRSSACKREV